MLIVKWVHLDGTEILAEAKDEITVRPFSNGAFNNENGPLVSEVRFERAGGEWSVISTGQVFVMNSTGKTIDRYYLAGVQEEPARS